QMARALSSSPEFAPVLFFDDSRDLQGSEILGLRVYPPSLAESLVNRLSLDVLLLAIPSATRSRKKEIILKFEALGLELKTLPGIAELVGGQVRIEDIREVGIEDLLGRDPVPPDLSLMGHSLSNKPVL